MQSTTKLCSLALSLALVAPALAIAADNHQHAGHGAAAAPAGAPATANDMTDGEIRKIERDTGRVTIKHGDIKNLDMPPMTMVFVAKDKAMLEGLKTGDKVQFSVVDEAGKFVLTSIRPAN
jgi:Cu(I)/Ag(I) efflux system protein CusF